MSPAETRRDKRQAFEHSAEWRQPARPLDGYLQVGMLGIVYKLIPAFGISFFVVIVVSLMTRPPTSAGEELLQIAARY